MCAGGALSSSIEVGQSHLPSSRPSVRANAGEQSDEDRVPLQVSACPVSGEQFQGKSKYLSVKRAPSRPHIALRLTLEFSLPLCLCPVSFDSRL